MTVKVPVNDNLSKTGFTRLASGRKVPTRNVKRVAALAAAEYNRNTAGATKGSGSWGAFEVRPGDTKALNGYAHKPGIWARPPRIVAAVGRKRLAKAIKAGKATAPTTTFNRRSGQSVTVPKVVNADVPRLLFLCIPKAEYQPDATPS